jgi:hypothetical protein
MLTADNLEHCARTALLCHLVIAQLVTRVESGEWLPAQHVVQATRRWSLSNDAAPAWFESIRLGRLSQDVASRMWALGPLRSRRRLATFFAEDGSLDHGSPVVRRIFAVCEAFLLSWDIARSAHCGPSRECPT